jgi:hypothetical protein
MSELDEIWVPLVDEPIGGIVEQIQSENPDISRLIESPRRLLAFRTFAYIRVGILLGQLLLENDVEPADGSDATWVEVLLARPEVREQIAAEVRAVAEEIAADPAYADEEPLGPDDGARERFRAFARRELGS